MVWESLKELESLGFQQVHCGMVDGENERGTLRKLVFQGRRDSAITSQSLQRSLIQKPDKDKEGVNTVAVTT